MKRSIRTRLVFWIVALLLPVSAGAAWLLVQLFGDRLLHDIDAAVEEEADTVAAALAGPGPSGAAADLASRIAAESDLPGSKYVLITRHGEVIGEAPAGSRRVLASDAPSLRAFRVQAGPAEDPVTVTIGVRATAALRAKHRLTLLLAIGTPLVLLIMVAGLWLVVGRALRPLKDASRQLEAIAVDDLSARVPVINAQDEVGRMVTVLNGLLERLERAIADLHRFTGDAAHELRTPVAVLRTGLEVALSKSRSAIEYRQALVEALAATERMECLAEDLLTLARLEQTDQASSVATVDLSEVLHELAEAWAQVAERRGIRLQVAAAPELNVSGKSGDLYRLFNNLIENAIWHSPRGGSVELGGQATADGVEGTVRDEGPGIAVEHAGRLFDRFYRGDGARTDHAGTGLGLSIAQTIARTHGGRITLSNADGGGCIARVTLPRAA